jgi:hypothetical protein
VVDVVQRFQLLLADGRIVEVSRDEHQELFSLVIGGYGMYGVILDPGDPQTRAARPAGRRGLTAAEGMPLSPAGPGPLSRAPRPGRSGAAG